MPASKDTNRQLGLDEVKRLIASSETAKKQMEESRHAASVWPGAYNLRLFAEAVDKRRKFVEFEPNEKRFKIKYNDRTGMAFISPAESGFVPCGYFSYEHLKETLNEHTT